MIREDGTLDENTAEVMRKHRLPFPKECSVCIDDVACGTYVRQGPGGFFAICRDGESPDGFACEDIGRYSAVSMDEYGRLRRLMVDVPLEPLPPPDFSGHCGFAPMTIMTKKVLISCYMPAALVDGDGSAAGGYIVPPFIADAIWSGSPVIADTQFSVITNDDDVQPDLILPKVNP